MFKVLVLAYYYPPMGLSGVQRTLKFTKYMSQFNWEPTVITAGNIAYFAHDFALLKEAENAGVKIIRTESYDPNSIIGRKYGTINMPKEFVRRLYSNFSKTFFIPDNKKSWAKRAYEKARELLKKEHFDIIFVTIPPYSSFVYAAKLKEEFQIPLFVDYRDLWLGNHFAFYPTPWHKIKHKKLEYKALHETNKIITINRRIKEKLLTTYNFLNFNEIVIIPHGFDPADFEGEIPKHNLTGKIKLTYSGIFYESVTPVYLLNAFKELSIERPDITAKYQLEFIGHLRNENKKLVGQLGLTDFVNEVGYLEHIEAVKRIRQSDVLWMMIGNSPNSDTISTSKLFEYFGSKKPILGCVPDGVAKSALLEYGASFITGPEDVLEIKKKLIEIHDLFIKNELPKPNEEFINKHNRVNLTEQLITQFQFYLRT